MFADNPALAILGCGNMGEAILAGLLRAKAFSPDKICVTTRRSETMRRIESRFGVRAIDDNLAACTGADVVLVALKPQRIAEVLDRDDMRAALSGKMLVSIAAGIKLGRLQRWLPGAALIRAMPNTPALLGEGMTVLARGSGVQPRHMEVAHRIFSAVGRTLELEDKHMDAVTGLNGSGPAFAYVMLEALADGGVMMGLPRDAALEIAASVFQGSARMVLETGFHPAALKDQVTTPAGCTIAGLLMMEDGRIRSVLARTIQEATKVAGRLGDEGTSDSIADD